jgi:hypothetical protein
LESQLNCFLSLEEGDIDLALVHLSSIVSYNESSGEVKILHASFVDFLSDKRRSNEFYIDAASALTEFDGIQGMVVTLITPEIFIYLSQGLAGFLTSTVR